jgi:hypothetical protein
MSLSAVGFARFYAASVAQRRCGSRGILNLILMDPAQTTDCNKKKPTVAPALRVRIYGSRRGT